MNRTAEEKLEMAVEVEQILKEKGLDYSVEYRKVWKNNVELDGLMIRADEAKVAPTVYFTDETASQLADRIENLMSNDHTSFDIEGLFKHDFFTKNLRPRLIADTEINREGLKNSGIEYAPFIDTGLIATLEVIIDETVSGTASIQLTSTHLKMADYTFVDALDQAVKNIEQNVVITSMRDIMIEMLNIPWDEAELIIPYDEVPMYVMTTRNKRYGAAALLSETCRNRLLDTLNTDRLYILPSSIHEVIAIPWGPSNKADLLNMVKEVNGTEVQPEDVLINAVYEVSRDTIKKVA